MSADRPPRPLPAFSIAVTGHRAAALAGVDGKVLAAQVESALRAARDGAQTLFAGQAALFADEPPVFRFLSPLADGADRIATEAALEAGYSVGAVLPFGRADYAQGFPDDAERAAYARLLGRASAVLELPGTRAAPGAAYFLAGQACVAHADMLLAIWDGAPARGRGGTAEVVDLAWRRGLPIIHVPVAAGEPTRLLWPGFDRHCGPFLDFACARPWSDDSLRPVLHALLAPPSQGQETRYLRQFHAEKQHLLRRRFEYPLLLMLAGVKRVSADMLRTRPYVQAAEEEWTPFRERCADPFGLSVRLGPVQDAYCWADGLAQHFAQSYRSGHVFNFLLGALAVLLALTSLLWKDGKVVLAFGELVAVLAIIANTRLGTTGEWHRRWLDYRQLAERLRPMRSLALLGLARPPPHGGSQRWTDWVAAATWRALDLPTGRIAPDAQAELARTLAQAELAPQVAYNRRSAQLSALLDHRLHYFGTLLFALTLVGTVLLIAGLFFFPAWVAAHSGAFVWVSAGLPALGTAIWGIRVQGDFSGTAQRSLATASRLEPVVAELEGAVPLPRAAALFEAASRIMVADLDEWRREHQKHELALP